MTATVRAIQTRYAGCHFRSRLEARWAVFFNHRGIEWEYEPQGYEVSYRISGGKGTFNYLPDFWLPEFGVWAEVKGSLTPEETIRLYNAVASLSSNDGAGCHDSGGHDVILLGPLTNGILYGNPVRLHMHKGDLIGTCFWCDDPHGRHVILAQDLGNGGAVDVSLASKLLAGFSCSRHTIDPRNLAALDAGRRARFEFGRRG